VGGKSDRFEGPDPLPYIDRLESEDAFFREAAAWSLGEIGSPRAGRPLAGLLLREVSTIERSGYIDHGAVVCAVSVAIRRIGATEALFAVVRALCALTRARGADRDTVTDLVETLSEVGGPHAVREAAEKVADAAKACDPVCPGLGVVATVLFDRLGLCGDCAQATLRRIAKTGPCCLRAIAQRCL
jgi:hypothetical protein